MNPYPTKVEPAVVIATINDPADPEGPRIPVARWMPPFQARVTPWMAECFGPRISADTSERNHRFIEEALELVQAGDMPRADAHALVEYVYNRPVGELKQEVGGVMVTLAALCLANEVDMHDCGETELARVWTKVEQIRAKQAAKPRGSALPVAVESRPTEWRERWYGSQPQRGWSIVAGRQDTVAYIGGDESMSDAIRAVVQAHNDAVAGRHSTPLRDAVERMVGMIEEREWAEHVAGLFAPGDALAVRLESAITDLHNEARREGSRAAECLRAALDWIDAIPAELAAQLPAMPGFDRDDAEQAIAAELANESPAFKHDMEGIVDALLAPREQSRNADGALYHPDMPIFDESVRVDLFLAALGLEMKLVGMEYDAPDLHEAASDANESRMGEWSPNPPGADWTLLEIYDTEDGPCATFVRKQEAPTLNARMHPRRYPDWIKSATMPGDDATGDVQRAYAAGLHNMREWTLGVLPGALRAIVSSVANPPPPAWIAALDTTDDTLEQL